MTDNPQFPTQAPMPDASGPEASDRELLAAYAASRSERALAQLVARHGPLILGACTRTLRDRDEAEDAAQMVFLVFSRRAVSLSPNTPLRPWFYRTARFTALAMRRSRARRERLLIAAATPDPVEAGDAASPLRDALDDALDSLSAPLRDAMVARFMAGLSEKHAAAELDCSVETLHKRVTRGMQHVRRFFARRGYAVALPAALAALGEAATAASPAAWNAQVLAACAAPAALPAARQAALARVESALAWAQAKTAASVAGIDRLVPSGDYRLVNLDLPKGGPADGDLAMQIPLRAGKPVGIPGADFRDESIGWARSDGFENPIQTARFYLDRLTIGTNRIAGTLVLGNWGGGEGAAAARGNLHVHDRRFHFGERRHPRRLQRRTRIPGRETRRQDSPRPGTAPRLGLR
jgi:RNA polymerase sigma factor (sigma-70 family)